MKILNNTKNKTYLSISLLGKSLKLDIKYRENPIIEINKKENKIELLLPKKYKNMEKVHIVNMAIEKLYDRIAQQELADRMEEIRVLAGWAPEDYEIRRMNDSFCKCLRRKIIVVNPDIIKYNRKIIDTTLIQAFCKLKYKDGSEEYKNELLKMIEKYENYSHRIITFSKEMKRVS